MVLIGCFYIMKKYNNNISNKSIENMYFHELLSLTNIIPELNEKYDQYFLAKLNKLILIRNKIAHCKVIDDSEFELLANMYHLMES